MKCPRALLVAEMPNRFRAVFSFGPTDDITGSGKQFTEAFDTADRREVELRCPGKWLHSIQCPTFVFEGTEGRTNLSALQAMANANANPNAKFYPVKGANHFDILAPVNRSIAKKILADTGTETNLRFTEAKLNQLFGN